MEYASHLHFFLIIFSVAVVLENIADILLTNLDESQGKSKEKNDVVAWFQSWLGSWWPAIKLWILALVYWAWIVPNYYGLPVGVVGLFIVMVAYFPFVKTNWDIYKGN